VLDHLRGFGLKSGQPEFDVPPARGLSYTGCISEIKINNVNIHK
jgi:hypothetical protein